MEEKNINKHLVVGIIIKSIAILASFYGMFMYMLKSNMIQLTYFTNISNVWIDIILVIFLVQDIAKLKNNVKENNRKDLLYTIKFLFTISITLTFLVYIAILGPTNEDGLINSYLNNGAASLCVHFITPILAIIDFLLFDYKCNLTNKHIVYAIIPPICYVLFVIILGQFGIRWSKYSMLAPYNFLNYGSETGWFGFDLSKIGPECLGIGVIYTVLVLVLLFIGIGKIYLLIINKRKKVK